MLAASDVSGKIPGHLYIVPRGGISFSGIASSGTSFYGRNYAVSMAYVPVPEARIGLQVTAGIESDAYRHYFDEKIFIEHVQRGISSDICACLSAGKKCRLLVGINLFLPFRREVEMGEKNFNDTYYYGNDSLTIRYKMNSFQASAVMAIDWSFGHKGQSHIGVRIAQGGNSPVREDAIYTDASGNTAVVSRKMKPASIQLYLSVRVVPREKRKEKLVESD